ncbi:MAG: iron-containing redox enzyme family protein [Alphaproteobacteria bacterium]
MTMMEADKALMNELSRTISALANAQFDSPGFRHLLALPLNKARAQAYVIQRTHWTMNRRDCWALAQGVAPYDVKKIIWDHEREELDGKPEDGTPDHYTLSVREAAALDLTEDDLANTPPCDGAETCMAAWLHLVKHSHWLTAVAACSALELSNSEAVLENGSMSRRMGENMVRDLGIPMKKQPMNDVHMVADAEHGNLLIDVAAVHMQNRADYERIVEGLRRSWTIDRVWKGQLADLLESIPLG